MKLFFFDLFCDFFDWVVLVTFGKDKLLSFYIGRMTALSLRHGVSRGVLHQVIDRCCIMLWEGRAGHESR